MGPLFEPTDALSFWGTAADLAIAPDHIPSKRVAEKCGFKRGKARGWDEHITDPGFEYYLDL